MGGLLGYALAGGIAQGFDWAGKAMLQQERDRAEQLRQESLLQLKQKLEDESYAKRKEMERDATNIPKVETAQGAPITYGDAKKAGIEAVEKQYYDTELTGEAFDKAVADVETAYRNPDVNKGLLALGAQPEGTYAKKLETERYKLALELKTDTDTPLTFSKKLIAAGIAPDKVEGLVKAVFPSSDEYDFLTIRDPNGNGNIAIAVNKKDPTKVYPIGRAPIETSGSAGGGGKKQAGRDEDDDLLNKLGPNVVKSILDKHPEERTQEEQQLITGLINRMDAKLLLSAWRPAPAHQAGSWNLTPPSGTGNKRPAERRPLEDFLIKQGGGR